MIVPDAQAMRDVRQAAGLTLADVSAALKSSRTSLSKWETGRQQPLPAQLQRWADYFNLRVFLVNKENTYTHTGAVAYAEGFSVPALVSLRKFLGYTQATLAAKMGDEHTKSLARWEVKGFTPRMQSLLRWAEALDAEFLIVGDDTPLAKEFDRE